MSGALLVLGVGSVYVCGVTECVGAFTVGLKLWDSNSAAIVSISSCTSLYEFPNRVGWL